MTISFHSLNCPSHVFGYMNKHRNQYSMRATPAFAVPPSSILIQTDESGNLMDSNKVSVSSTAPTSTSSGGSLLNQAKTVGIIGGASVSSTLNYLKKLVQWSSKDAEDSPPFVLCNDPLLSKELSLHERSSPRSLTSKNETLKIDHVSTVENLRKKTVFLENSGAKCIVMPCHISHSWHKEVSRGCSVPFFHMGECVARELREAKLRPLEAGSPPRIGVLAPEATLMAGFYQQKLQNEGFDVVLPDKATMEHTVIPAIDALHRKDMEGARNLLRIALQVLLVRAVNTVILASDELQELLPRDDPLLKKCVDPMDALVRSTIKWIEIPSEGI
ncbi:Aspartate racemase [Bertholletia excelsa]